MSNDEVRGFRIRRLRATLRDLEDKVKDVGRRLDETLDNEPIIGTADTRARMEEALPTDPEVIIERNRREREKAAEFDRLLRDNELVRLQSNLIQGLHADRDRLAKRVRTLEGKAVTAPPEKRERGDRRSEPYRQEQCRRRPVPQKVEVKLVKVEAALKGSLNGKAVAAFNVGFDARVLDVVDSPPTGEHHLEWEWTFGCHKHNTGQTSHIEGVLVNEIATAEVRVRAGGWWVDAKRQSFWSKPVSIVLSPAVYIAFLHQGEAAVWRNYEEEDAGACLNIV